MRKSVEIIKCCWFKKLIVNNIISDKKICNAPKGYEDTTTSRTGHNKDKGAKTRERKNKQSQDRHIFTNHRRKIRYYTGINIIK